MIAITRTTNCDQLHSYYHKLDDCARRRSIASVKDGFAQVPIRPKNSYRNVVVVGLIGMLLVSLFLVGRIRSFSSRAPLVGIVGGLGPSANVYLLQQILETDYKRCSSHNSNSNATSTALGFSSDACHTPHILYSNPQIPNNNLAALGAGPPSIASLIDSCRALDRAGATTVVFACTAAYTWQDEVARKCGIPVFDLLEETVQHVANDHHETIGLLDVDGTLRVGRFQAAFEKHGIEVILPNAAEQAALMEAVSSWKRGAISNPQERMTAMRTTVKEISQQLKQRDKTVTAIVYGCTDIAAAMGTADKVLVEDDSNDDNDLSVYNTLQILANAIVQITNRLELNQNDSKQQ